MLTSKSLYFEYNRSTQGESLLILGESGIGKTTLLHLLAGLLRPKTGSIELNDENLTDMSSTQLDRFRGSNIGLVFQRPHFIQSLSLKDNLALVQHLGRQQNDTSRISFILDNLGIKDKMNQYPRHLSQGQQQRASIALAVINNPKLILADEPTSSLDDNNCSKVAQLLHEQAQASNANLIVITHDQRLKKDFKNVITL